MRFNIRHPYHLALALAGLAVAQPGRAGVQADCIAANFPAASSQAAADSYLKGGFDQMQAPSADILGDIVRLCLPGGTSASQDATLKFSQLVAAYLSLKAGEGALVRRHGLSQAAIDSAWTRLAPDHRDRFARAGKSDEASTRAMIAFTGALRPDISPATLEGLRAPLGSDGPIKALLPFIIDATLYGMSRGMLETDR